MDQLIASYLFQHKTCPLPGIGTLSVIPGKAGSDFLNKSVTAPVPAIIFDNKENDASGLLDYIAARTNQTVLEAIEKLGQFTNSLKAAMITNKPAALNGVGHFFTDVSGHLKFEQIELPAVFVQPVIAERVIHPESEHQILVGDKETTNTLMTEYFNESPVKKSKWWIWAIVLGAIAIVAILIYLNKDNISSMLGNAMPI